MYGRCLFNTIHDRLLKRCTIRIVLRVQTLFFDKFPEAFNQIQVWGIGGQVEQLNPQRLGNRLHECTPLIAGVVQDEGDWKARVCARQQKQQLTDGLRRNIREIRDGQDLVRDSIQRGQHI